jgi:hypothetical protein
MLNEEPLRHFASIDDFDEHNIHIRIPSIQREHGGQISLRAKNECGEDVKKFTLHVVDVPSAPRGIEAEIISGKAVEISWEPSREDKDAPVEYYLVERKTAEHSRWRQCGKVRPQQPLRLIVDELFTDEIYVFRVVACNEVGRGVPSQTIGEFGENGKFFGRRVKLVFLNFK